MYRLLISEQKFYISNRMNSNLQHFTQHIKRQLNELYSPSEISFLTRIILEEVSDKINNLSDAEQRKFEDIVWRLKNSEPIQYILGKTEFYGLTFLLNQDVLIPRPETEELVDWIISDNNYEYSTILDVGTGSGCISVTLAKKIPNSYVYAWDISKPALKVATKNAAINSVDIHFSNLDVLSDEDLKTHYDSVLKYDIIVSNPPYVREMEKQEMDKNVLEFEPHIALFVPDDNPLLFYKRIADVALKMLKGGGKLYFEINTAFANELIDDLNKREFINIELKKDISGKNRMIKAETPRSSPAITSDHPYR